MFERGTLRVGSYRGAPILMHWSLPLGLLVFGGLRVVPGFWLGFTLMILLHELGHAYLVRRMGFGVQAVVVHGFGGFCSWQGQASRLEHSVIAWGGVVMQALLLLGTFGYVHLVGHSQSNFGYQLEQAWLHTNLWIIGLNLLPVAPLDGAEAWQIFRAMRVESVSFSDVLRRCLPGLGARRPKPPKRPPSDGPPAPRRDQRVQEAPPKRDGKPSAEAQAAIAEALEKVAQQAREARRKK